MLPVEILISEHSLILLFVNLIEKEIQEIKGTKVFKPSLISAVVDFFKIYADKYHHGKEEGILFKGLSQKKLSEAGHKMMIDLIMEHAFARKKIHRLESVKESYVEGKTEMVQDALQLFNDLITLYPKHIEKENSQFFYQSMKYFTQEEQNDMLERSRQFDQNFTNKHYKQIVDALEKQVP